MSTTGAVAEILVAGLLALLWLIGGFSLFDQEGAAKLLTLNLSSGSAVLVLAFSYQLGWIVNSVTYWMARHSYFESLRVRVLGAGTGRDEYERLKVSIYGNKDHDHLIRLLEQETAVDRIARAGGLNLLMLSLVGFGEVMKDPKLSWTIASLVLLVLGVYSWRVSYNRAYRYLRLIRQAGSVFNLQGPGVLEAGAKNEKAIA
jgi:hypothetical protein